MAITAATKTSDFSGFLTREQSEAIFEKAAQQSVVQRLARRVPLGINGQSIPVVTGKVSASHPMKKTVQTKVALISLRARD